MTENLLDLSGKVKRDWINVFLSLQEVTERLETPYFIVGATARDLVLEHGFGVKPVRATKDIDLGVRVDTWDTYDGLLRGLVSTGRFVQSKQEHRLLFDGALPVDIIPFGPIAKPLEKITWPKDPDFTMSLSGFDEAYELSLPAKLSNTPRLVVRVSMPQSLAVLKLISWKERSAQKDAEDFALIMRTYLDLGNIDRLNRGSADLLHEPDFDYESAGARLLGRDMRSSCNEHTQELLRSILRAETGSRDRHRLVEAMAGPDLLGDGDRFARMLNLLEWVSQGFEEGASYDAG